MAKSSYKGVKSDVPLTSKNGYTPSEKDSKTLKMWEGWFSDAEKARKNKVARWRRNEELYNGDYFKPFKMPKYQSKIVANVIRSNIETIYALLTDAPTKIDVMPKSEDQIFSAREAQMAVDNEWKTQKAQLAINMMKLDGLIYGNGYVKISQTLDGKLYFSNPDVYTVFFDPLATDISNAKFIMFATPMYCSDIKDMFKRGKYVEPEGKLDAYKSFIMRDEDDDTNIITQTGVPNVGGVPIPGAEVQMMGGPGQMDGTEPDFGGGQALVKECWYVHEGKYCMTTWANGVLLQETEAPFPFYPLINFKNNGDAHSVYGSGEPEKIETLALGSAILLSQAVDNTILHGNPAWELPKSMMQVAGNRPSNKPGQVFYTNGPHENVKRIPPSAMSAGTLPLVQSMMQMSDTVSGVHDVTMGRKPGGVTAGSAIKALQEASQTIIRQKERDTNRDAIIDMYRYSLWMIKNFYDQDIVVRSLDEQTGEYAFTTINPLNLDIDLDFNFVPSNGIPETRQERMVQGMEMLQMGLLDQEKFWRWMEKDISGEILEEIMEQKKAMMEQKERDMEILATSTDENELMEAKLRQMPQEDIEASMQQKLSKKG